MPWEMSLDGKKRLCDINGIRKMNQYYLQKQKQKHDEAELKRSGTAGMQWQKVSYRDEDMQQLVTQKKGTTSSYSYQ